jgi:predicted cupin superfamily sugar epimerase
MNEEDTFNLLRRTPISELHTIYMSRFWEFYNYPNEYSVFLENNGWTEYSFIEAGKAYEKSLRMRNGVMAGESP